MAMAPHDKRGHVVPHIYTLDKKCNDATDGTNNHHLMPMPVLMASHDQKAHVALHFDHLDLKNAMAPLLVLFTSHDTYTNANYVI